MDRARQGGNIVKHNRRANCHNVPAGVQKAQLMEQGLMTPMSQATYDRTLSQAAIQADQSPSVAYATASIRVGGRETGRKFY